MSFVDNDPPKHASISDLSNPKRLSIYNVGNNRRGLISRLLEPYFISYNL